MISKPSLRGAIALAWVVPMSLSCAQGESESAVESSQTAAASSYLYVWAGAEDETDSDFLAVIDADPESERYAQIVASVPVGLKGGAHHSEHVMPKGDTLFVNSFKGGASFLIDLSEPLAPKSRARSGKSESTRFHTHSSDCQAGTCL